MNVDLRVDVNFELDLKDDFIMNHDYDLYEFIGGDPTKAFYLGVFIKEWFELLEKEQKYLYSKQIRHNKDDLEKYQTQLAFWMNKKKGMDDDEAEVDLAELAEYILNNMFWDEETEDLDRVKMAFFFGQLLADESEKSKDNN